MRPASDPIPPSEAPVDSIGDLARDQAQKKRRTMIVLFGVIPVVAGIIGVAWWYFGKQAAEEDIARAWSQASGCLVGAPLAEGDKASLRVRAIQLTAIHAERDRKDDTRWPARCGDAVAELYEALRKHGRTDGGPEGLAGRAEPLAALLRKAEVMQDLSLEIDGLFEAARAMGLEAQPASLQVPTPEPAKGLDLDTLPESAHITPLQYTLDNVTAPPMVDSEIHALIYDKKVDDKPILCAFSPVGNDRCRTLGGELVGKSGLSLAGTVDDGASPLVLSNQGSDGVYRSDGTFEKITELDVHSAYVAKDGYVALAGWAKSRKSGRFDLVEQAAPGAPTRTIEITPDDLGEGAYQANRVSILWGKLMVQALFGDEGNPVPRLIYADLPIVDRPQFKEVAEINWVNASLFGCRVKDSLAVGLGQRSGFVTFYENAAWSPPVPIDWMSPAVACHAGELVFTDGFGSQLRCTPAECKHIDGVPPTFEPFKVKQSFWSDLNGKVLALASTEDRGGVRYRLADGKNLGDPGTDLLLFDDMIKDGALQKESTLLGMLLASRGSYAIALMTTPKGVYALRFDSDGVPKPAQIKR